MTDSLTLDDYARLLGGRQALQDLLGVGPSALSNYVKRGTIPVKKRALLDKAVSQNSHKQPPLSQNHISEAPICLLIITGGIAAYKALDLARRMQDAGYQVRGVMTKSAEEFITPLSLSALTGEAVYTELFSLTDEQEMGHIRLAREADLVLVAPATGNFIAKLALGLADDLASTLCLASTAPLYLVPAMNPVMWAHEATQANCATLRARGAVQIGPVSGDTACGEIGSGRMSDVVDIVAAVKAHHHGGELASLNSKALAGLSVLLTAGPTEEPIDGVRFISNRSSGKQGYAIAEACQKLGAEVTLISGPTALPCPKGVARIDVQTARQMHEATLAQLPADIAICTAAVADWHVRGAGHKKVKKEANAAPPQLDLVENPDILKAICAAAHRPPLVIGFAAETDNPLDAARAKRRRKGCDWLLVNHITEAAPVFGADDNQLTLMTDHDEISWPRSSKQQLADRLASEIAAYFETESLPS